MIAWKGGTRPDRASHHGLRPVKLLEMIAWHGGSIRPFVPSNVVYEVRRQGNEPSNSPPTMYSRPQGWHQNREVTVQLPVSRRCEPRLDRMVRIHECFISVVNIRERKMLCALFAVGTESVWYSVMGKPHCRRKGTDLTDRVISVEQGKPLALPARGKSIARWTDGDLRNGNGSKRRPPCNGADRGCFARLGQDHLAGNGADFPLVLNSPLRNRCMKQSK